MNKWINNYTRKQDCVHRLFCLPYAGGAASKYAAWKRCTPDNAEIVPIQIPGRESRIREPFAQDFTSLASEIAKNIAEFSSDKMPFSVFGHSMGGSMAFEVTKELEHREIPPMICFISSTDLVSMQNLPSVSAMTDTQLFELVSRYGAGEELETLKVFPRFYQLFMRIIRADFVMLQKYTMNRSEKISTPICAYYSDCDKLVNEKMMNIWGKMTNGGFRCKCFAGDHFYLFRESRPLLRDIFQSIRSKSTERWS